ncbi:MAG: DUF6998 domain-containing protein [Verrucomicrobiaceae bacterium]
MSPKQVLELRKQTRSHQGRALLDNNKFRPLPSQLKPGFKKLIEGRDLLREEYLKHTEGGDHEARDFSLDGRLVGDLGELVAAMIAPIILTEGAGPEYDGHFKDDATRKVQVRCSLRDDSIAIKHGDGHFIAIQLKEDDDGQYRVVYDGPALNPWIYVNATKKTGERDTKRETTRDKLKPLKLTTWALLNVGIDDRFVKP